jgi:hypothetical protein
MDNQNNDSRFVFAQFCDDIRQEIGQKFSLMGCYGSEMIIDKLPASLPKLGILVKIFTGTDRPFSHLLVRALMNDEILAELEIPVAKSADAFQKIASTTDLGRVGLQAILVLSPLVVVEPCKIRIEAETEEGIIRGSYIKLRQRTPEDPPL